MPLLETSTTRRATPQGPRRAPADPSGTPACSSSATTLTEGRGGGGLRERRPESGRDQEARAGYVPTADPCHARHAATSDMPEMPRRVAMPENAATRRRHLTESVEGKLREIHLCAPAARKAGVLARRSRPIEARDGPCRPSSSRTSASSSGSSPEVVPALRPEVHGVPHAGPARLPRRLRGVRPAAWSRCSAGPRARPGTSAGAAAADRRGRPAPSARRAARGDRPGGFEAAARLRDRLRKKDAVR